MAAFGVQANVDGSAEQAEVLSHPIACFFHIFFKALAVLVYLVLYYVYDSFITVFIAVVVLLACDFWVVKNVSGRLLVGLRWWNDIKDDGSDEWVFESLEDRSTLNRREFYYFWGAMVLNGAVWVVLAIVSVLKLSPSWIIVCIIAIVMNYTNLGGYFKCARESKNEVQSAAQGWFAERAVAGLMAGASGASNA